MISKLATIERVDSDRFAAGEVAVADEDLRLPADALWQQTDTVFTWTGPKLERTSRHTSDRRFSYDIEGPGFPPTTLTSIRC